MTAPAETFDPRTAKQLAAKIVDGEMCGYEDEEVSPLVELHNKCFTALGNTPDEIAAKLTEYGCLGTPPHRIVPADDPTDVYGDMHDDKGNALALYFRAVCGAASAAFQVDDGMIYWAGTLPGSMIGHESVTLPPAVREFQQGYQDFNYEQLFDPTHQVDTYDEDGFSMTWPVA
jgi:hypothetical protein